MTASVSAQPQRSAALVASLWVIGVLCLAALAFMFAMKAPPPWRTLALAWVLLTYLADEAGNWFGYLAALLGALPFVLGTAPEQWFMVFPLLVSGLIASLLLKHAGGLLLLPFAAAAFALPILATAKLAPYLDDTVKLAGSHAFQNRVFLAAGIGLGLSLLRQLTELVLRRRAQRRA